MQVHVCVHVCAAPTPSTWAAHTLNQGQRREQGRADTCSYNAGQRGCHAAGLTRGWGGSWRRGPFRRALDPPASASWPRPRPLRTCCSIQVTFCAEASAGPRPLGTAQGQAGGSPDMISAHAPPAWVDAVSSPHPAWAHSSSVLAVQFEAHRSGRVHTVPCLGAQTTGSWGEIDTGL